MTATYWEVGRRIVEFEQGGEKRAEYGAELLKRLGVDLSTRFGRGFSSRNLFYMRKFYAEFPSGAIVQTPSAKSAKSSSGPASFPLPWAHYVLLLGRAGEDVVENAEALRGTLAEAAAGTVLSARCDYATGIVGNWV